MDNQLQKFGKFIKTVALRLFSLDHADVNIDAAQLEANRTAVELKTHHGFKGVFAAYDALTPAEKAGLAIEILSLYRSMFETTKTWYLSRGIHFNESWTR